MTERIMIGDVFTNNDGETATIVGEKVGTKTVARRLDVKFDYDGTIISVSTSKIRGGSWANPNRPSVYGVGYTGKGKYYTSIRGTPTKAYRVWESMISRCYNNNDQAYTSYGGSGVIVDNTWHNFQIFAAWWSMNTYEHKGCGKTQPSIDKDLKTFFSDTARYSPETCCVIPLWVNNALSSIKKHVDPRLVGDVYTVDLARSDDSFNICRTYSKSLAVDMTLTSKIIQLVNIRHGIERIDKLSSLVTSVDNILIHFYDIQRSHRENLLNEL